MKINRTTVDLSAYPDLVVIYLGMRVNSLRGLKTLAGFGPQIKAAVAAKPDGLLLHEDLIFSLWPLHAGMRQYWRDFESMEIWARSTMPHQKWWKDFLRDPGGTGFWHETRFRRGGIRGHLRCPSEPDRDDAICAERGGARADVLGAAKSGWPSGEARVTPPVAEGELP